jgi:hypothetical protein
VVDREQWRIALAEAATQGSEQPRRICQLCVAALDVTGAGISMVTEAGNRGVVCATDETSAAIEQLQFTLGEGPCVDTISTYAPVLIGDLRDDPSLISARWPGFLAAAAAAGVRAVFAFPLTVGGVRLGAMDLYRDRPGELTASDLSVALLAADSAAIALLHLANGSDGDFLADVRGGAAYQLHVHQATGMVMEQLGVSIESALVRLRARAYAEDQELESLARDVIERRTRFQENP